MNKKEVFSIWQITEPGKYDVEVTLLVTSPDATIHSLKINNKGWIEGRVLNTLITKLVDKIKTGTGEGLVELCEKISLEAEKEYDEFYKRSIR